MTPNGEAETMKSTNRGTTTAGQWVTGSAYEFLGLSPEEAAYVDLKLRLSKALWRHRMRKPLSQVALAKLLDSSQSRVAKMESGDPSVTIDLLLRALIRLGVTRSEIARVLVFEEPKSLQTSTTAAADYREMPNQMLSTVSADGKVVSFQSWADRQRAERLAAAS